MVSKLYNDNGIIKLKPEYWESVKRGIRIVELDGVEYLVITNNNDLRILVRDVVNYPLVTTLVTSTEDLFNFYNSKPEEFIMEHWDMSNVIDMRYMFAGCSNFNQPIGNWDVSNVKNMKSMFLGCKNFNQPIGNWDVSNVKDMNSMFTGCSNFNQLIGNWDVSNVSDMNHMFKICKNFNQPLDGWVVSNVKDMDHMFHECRDFNQPIANWDVSNVQNMESMFTNCKNFNQTIGNWDVSNVENMRAMFLGCENFNQPIGNWDVSNVRDMGGMFYKAHNFNQPLNLWDVSNVQNMDHMFYKTSNFNQPIGNWDVSKVENMGDMFKDSGFRGDLSSWNFSSDRVKRQVPQYIRSPRRQSPRTLRRSEYKVPKECHDIYTGDEETDIEEFLRDDTRGTVLFIKIEGKNEFLAKCLVEDFKDYIRNEDGYAHIPIHMHMLVPDYEDFMRFFERDNMIFLESANRTHNDRPVYNIVRLE